MEQFSIDEVARTTDQQMVRSRFDAQNLAWLRVLAWTAAVFTAIGVITLLAGRSGPKAIIMAVAFVASAVVIVSSRTRATGKVATALREHTTAYAIGWCVLQTVLAALLLGGSDGIIACGLIFPMTMLGFRMLPSELLSLHGIMAGIVVASISIAPPATKTPRSVVPMIITTAGMNALMLAIELRASRRWKRQIVREWSERRAIAQEQVRMRDELHYAREVQLSMLPAEPPQLAWVDVAGLSLPASEVGGDYYDYLSVGDGLAIVTGDVAGHGLASGIMLAALRGGFTLLRESLSHPARVLQRLHELVAQTSRRRMLVTCAVLLLEPGRRRATIASAGHPPLLLRRRDNGSVERIELFAPPLGVRLPLKVESTELAWSAGDVFVLHSDGVYETRNADGDTYGFERLENVVRSSDGAAAWQMCDAIVRDLAQFRGSVAQDDDVTIVVARMV